MFRAGRTTAVKENAAAAAELARKLATDKKLRKQLLRASGHAARADRRVRGRFGPLAALRQIAMDEELRTELKQLMEELQAAWTRVEKTRHHQLRTSLLVAAGSGAVAAIALPRPRQWLRDQTQNLSRGQEPEQKTEAQPPA